MDNFFIGVLVVNVIYNFVCNKQCPSTWNQICLGSHKMHIHHWMIHTVGIVALMFVPLLRDNELVRGLLVGGVVHGLAYPDWYVICKRC